MFSRKFCGIPCSRGEVFALDRLAGLLGRGKLDRRPHRVIRLRRDAHRGILTAPAPPSRYRSRSSISTLLNLSPTLVACATSMPVDDVTEQVVVRRELAGAVVDADEELRSVRVGTGVRHRDRAERVLALHRLVGELVAGTTATAALGATALDHELRHDAVEREVVVVALAREPDEVVDGVRRELRVEIHHDRTAVGRDRHSVDLRPRRSAVRASCWRPRRAPYGLVVGVVGGLGQLPAFTASASADSTCWRSGWSSGAITRNCWNATAPSHCLFSICASSRPLKT